MRTQRSNELFKRAQELLPGGVDSPVRAFQAVGGQPFFVERGQGAYLQDVDGNRYIDYVLSWGPLILGHAHPAVVAAVKSAAESGTSFGAPSPLELELAGRIQQAMPSLQMLRFVNSGTEATMSALRLARAYSQRHKIVKFAGCYHGHADLLLVQAGSGAATLGLPDSPGVPPATVGDTLAAQYNDLGSVARLFEAYPGEIAAVIVEPVAGNMGVVPPADGFLSGLRELTSSEGAVLIFDEVMTGFRVHPGGAQALYGVRPDLTTLGKVIGGGLPVGAYGGKRAIMEMIAPAGPVYQAGTLSGNPLAMAAGIAALEELGDPIVWQALEHKAEELQDGIAQAAGEAVITIWQNRVGSMFTTFFSNTQVRDWPTAKASDTTRYRQFFQGMLARGVFLAPSQFEAGFMSIAHGQAEIHATIAAAREVFQEM